MKVLKFGGTSVGSVENMTNVKNIINDGEKKIVVLSAMSGTTNQLVAISKDIEDGYKAIAIDKINTLRLHYLVTVDALLQEQELNVDVKTYVASIFNVLLSCAEETASELLYNKIVAQGELLSTYMFNAFLRQEGIKASLLSALDFMKIDEFKEPDLDYIKENFEKVFNDTPESDIYITQGFICLDEAGEISNLQRGGSDYTATIIGAAFKVEEVQIWTDIDGMHNNDPRYVENTHPISNLSFDEAAELAYFGAKILHPQTVTPVRKDNIPVRLKNTMDPEAHGTLISNKTSETGIKAIAAKDGITAIKIKSARMLQAHGFLKKVFEVFETYKTSIDMITTSEVAVSLTIDNDSNLEPILTELDKIAVIEVDKNQSIVCLVGHSVVNHQDTFKLFQILQDVKIRMISYGGSKNNISLLIDSNDKINTLQKLNDYLFELVTH
ncbi:aspartate kinase [Tamlana fucoidanivorans]|uniref:Aspartokinase n=1 Tax=Allotamlana fucoidanivorans TaxID=2583814 RepID=A0A5C4SK00_9FLAO|nr:aspartate kinase [Tamlana fucoidanivorans]TNJ44165.1 aspartate kinase [Tamlana fucoidanivorans]